MGSAICVEFVDEKLRVLNVDGCKKMFFFFFVAPWFNIFQHFWSGCIF